MRLVHKHPVHAQLFKGHNIVLAVFGLQLFQPRLQPLLGPLQLLDGKPFAAAGLYFLDALSDLPRSVPAKSFLALPADGDALKLGVADDDGVIIAGGDPGAELFPVGSRSPFWWSRMLAEGYSRKNSDAHCSVRWFGTTKMDFWHSPRRLDSMAAATISKAACPRPLHGPAAYCRRTAHGRWAFSDAPAG